MLLATGTPFSAAELGSSLRSVAVLLLLLLPVVLLLLVLLELLLLLAPKATAKVDQERKRSSVELLSGDGKSEQNAKIGFHPAARPLNGWDDDGYQASGRPKWRDPRRCKV